MLPQGWRRVGRALREKVRCFRRVCTCTSIVTYQSLTARSGGQPTKEGNKRTRKGPFLLVLRSSQSEIGRTGQEGREQVPVNRDWTAGGQLSHSQNNTTRLFPGDAVQRQTQGDATPLAEASLSLEMTDRSGCRQAERQAAVELRPEWERRL